MKRGGLYRVYRGSQNDPKDYRVFLGRGVSHHFQVEALACFLNYGGGKNGVSVCAQP